MTWQEIHRFDQLLTLKVNSWSSPITDPIWQFFSNIPVWIPMYVLIVALIIWRLGWKKGLIVVLAAAGLIALCWFLGSPEKVEILGYEGTDNVGNMARMSDAIMYLVYILTASTVVALVWGVIYTKIKK